jgi:hypothetical protein
MVNTDGGLHAHWPQVTEDKALIVGQVHLGFGDQLTDLRGNFRLLAKQNLVLRLKQNSSSFLPSNLWSVA